jgi:hypothetical protein
MAMTRAEKERLNDIRLKLQSAARSLQHLPESDIPDYDQIEKCLDNADQNLRDAVQSSE